MYMYIIVYELGIGGVARATTYVYYVVAMVILFHVTPCSVTCTGSRYMYRLSQDEVVR